MKKLINFSEVMDYPKENFSEVVKELSSDRGWVTHIVHTNTPIKTAQRGCTRYLNVIREAGADVNLCDKRGNTALIYATSNEHSKCIDRLIKSVTGVNTASPRGIPPLMSTIQNEIANSKGSRC